MTSSDRPTITDVKGKAEGRKKKWRKEKVTVILREKILAVQAVVGWKYRYGNRHPPNLYKKRNVMQHIRVCAVWVWSPDLRREGE